MSLNINTIMEQPLKFLTANIKPFKLKEVPVALSAIGGQGMSVTEAKGFAHFRFLREIKQN